MIFKTKTQRRLEFLEAEISRLWDAIRKTNEQITIEGQSYSLLPRSVSPPPAISVKVAIEAIFNHLRLEVYHSQGVPAFNGVRKKAVQKSYTQDPLKDNPAENLQEYKHPTPPPKEQS